MHALSKFLPNDFDPAGGLTLLSGKGAYPRLVAERARAAGMDVSLIAIVDEVDPEFVETFPRERVLWAKVGQLGKFLSNLEKLRSRYFIMAGQVAPKRLFQGLVPDLKAALVLARLKERNAHTIFGAVAGFAGGWVDIIMMRITDILYTIPDVLLIIVLSLALKPRLEDLAEQPGFGWMNTVGPNLIAIFLVFVLLYWVGMARITRSQILVLKESEYVTAARALGASSSRIIRKHLLTNCIGTLIVTTTLQIPSAIFTESYLSFLGLGVAAPMPSLGSLATDAVKGMNTYPHLLFLPAILISVIILAFNLFGDGLRDAFDPKLKN